MWQTIGLIVAVYSLIRLIQAPVLVVWDTESPVRYLVRLGLVILSSVVGVVVIGALTLVLMGEISVSFPEI